MIDICSLLEWSGRIINKSARRIIVNKVIVMYDPATNPEMSSDLSYTKLFDAMQALVHTV